MFQDFCFHIHTQRCGHAENITDREIVELFLSHEFKSIAFTDHAPWNSLEKIPGHKNWMDADEKPGYLDSIKALRKEYAESLEILLGFELEYFPNWLDEINQMRSESQIIVLGQHYCLNPDTGKYTRFHIPGFVPTEKELDGYCQLIEMACRSGIVDIIAHPDLYMLQTDSFGIKQEETAHRICSIAQEFHLPVEINLTQIAKSLFFKGSSIKYPCREFWHIASQYKLKTLLGMDFHHRLQLEHYDDTVDEAKRIIGKENWNKLDFCTREEIHVPR